MSLILPRRRFLAGLVGLVAAPAVVRAASLMPVHSPRVITIFIAPGVWLISEDGNRLISWWQDQAPVPGFGPWWVNRGPLVGSA